MTALKAGCEQRPAAGELIGLSGSLFAGEPVNITSPPTQMSTDSKGDSGFGITSTGAIVGISLGGALLLLGGIALFWIYHRRQKRMFGRISSPDNDSRTGNRSTTPFGGGLSTTEKRATSQMSDYELHTQRNYTNNAEYYKMLERGMHFNRANYAADPNIPMSGPQNVLPAHPAYIPQTHSRQGSREESPQPPRPIKTNKPDSYAIQVYLNAAEETGALDLLPPPPPGPPPAAAFRGPSSNQYLPHSRDSSMDGRGPSPDKQPLLNPAVQPTGGMPNPPPPPPPPPPSTRPSKVPSLAFPSVSRIRVPKKYTPPKITVHDATPVDESSALASFSGAQQQADISVGLGVSNPIVPSESHTEGKRRKQPPPPLDI